MTGWGREISAGLVGTGVAIAIMLWAWRSIGWPAPGVAIASGIGVYLLLRSGLRSRYGRR
ncbi:MAG: hypothetical protein HKP27_15105 [Myxococcales bacterium]|nr:hypothetical protein [Myxococcales bacterium]